MKKILINNLGVKHFAELKFIDPCDTCTVEQISGYNCRSECDPDWEITYLFKCQDLIRLIRDISGVDFNTVAFGDDTNIPKYMKIMKYYLMEYNIKGFGILFNDDKDYIQVVKL